MRLSDDELAAVAKAYRDAGESARGGARALGMPRDTFRHRLDAARARGFLTDPAVQDAMRAANTQMVPALAWIKTKSDDGASYSVLLKPEQAPEDVAARVRDVLADLPAVGPIEPPETSDADLLTLYPFADAHIGLLAWGRETGEDYDTRTAAARIRDWVGECIAASPRSRQAIVLGAGDLLHADDTRNETPRSKHKLDVDTRHFRTLEIAIEAMASAVDMAAARHELVTVRILPGNHDPHAYMAVLFALAQRYRETPRVTVEVEPGEFWAHQFGRVLLAAHHGDKAKTPQMVMYLAARYADLWGASEHRYLWTGHLHHLKAADVGGVQWEQLRAIASGDAYSVAHAYVAKPQMQAITYHRERGEVRRVKVGL